MQYLPLFSNNLSVFAVLNYIPNVLYNILSVCYAIFSFFKKNKKLCDEAMSYIDSQYYNYDFN